MNKERYYTEAQMTYGEAIQFICNVLQEREMNGKSVLWSPILDIDCITEIFEIDPNTVKNDIEENMAIRREALAKENLLDENGRMKYAKS